MDWPISHFRHASANEVDAFVKQPVIELLVTFARRAHVNVEVVNFGADALANQVGQLQRVHAADFGAPAVGVLVPRTYAVADSDYLRLGAVAQPDLAASRSRGVDQSLDFQSGIYVGMHAVT